MTNTNKEKYLQLTKIKTHIKQTLDNLSELEKAYDFTDYEYMKTVHLSYLKNYKHTSILYNLKLTS